MPEGKDDPKKNGARIRTLIVDDSEAFARAFAGYVSTWPRLELVGMAANGTEALELVAKLRPSLVFMDLDLGLSDLNGLQVSQKIRGLDPLIRVIMVTVHDSTEVKSACLALGIVDRFIAKDALRQELGPALADLFPSGGTEEPIGASDSASPARVFSLGNFPRAK